eukprot:TRINITY_DN3921_c0_g1_i5.p1 TRINITY_DN3921_c0_g1~~TRINITY_DN3921_c0_g1_i5.p1  ORF type:complete len:162 (-),score=47.04 TRINITY_DN3921_c0_g1_i5:66-551(-)
MQDISRLARFHGLSMKVPPSQFPTDSLPAQRILTAIDMSASPAGSSEALSKASRAFWQAYWGQDKDLSDVTVLKEALAGAGFSQTQISTWLEQAGSAPVKKRLKSYTDQAIEAGAFGMPTMLVRATPQAEPSFYFGSDRFHLIFQELNIPWICESRIKSKL